MVYLIRYSRRYCVFCHLNIFENCVQSEKRDVGRVLRFIGICRWVEKEEYIRRLRKVNEK